MIHEKESGKRLFVLPSSASRQFEDHVKCNLFLFCLLKCKLFSNWYFLIFKKLHQTKFNYHKINVFIKFLKLNLFLKNYHIKIMS